MQYAMINIPEQINMALALWCTKKESMIEITCCIEKFGYP